MHAQLPCSILKINQLLFATALSYVDKIDTSGQYYKLFTAIITPLAAYFSMILTELRQKRRNYGRKKFYKIGHSSYIMSIHFLRNLRSYSGEPFQSCVM